MYVGWTIYLNKEEKKNSEKIAPKAARESKNNKFVCSFGRHGDIAELVKWKRHKRTFVCDHSDEKQTTNE